MRWFRVVIEPGKFQSRSAFAGWFGYSLCVPLVSDGRLAAAHLGMSPGRAEVIRFREGCEDRRGLLVQLDGQWTLTWTQPLRRDRSNMRLFGARFALGDILGLRPLHGPIQLFTVRSREPADSEFPAALYSLA